MTPRRSVVDLAAGAKTGLSAPSTILVVTEVESWARSMEAVLNTSGYSSLAVPTAAAVVDALRTMAPAAVIAQADGRETPAADVLRAVREHSCDPSRFPTPVFLTSAAPFTREQRIAAYKAGAWACETVPFDVGEFLARMANFGRIREAVTRARADSLSAYGTDLYSHTALLRVADGALSRAQRYREPLSAIVFGPAEPVVDTTTPVVAVPQPTQPIRRLVKVLSVASRSEDCTGFIDPNQIAMIAPNTDSVGAVRLVERLLSVSELLGGGPPQSSRPTSELLAGCAVWNRDSSREINVTTLIDRARAAFLSSQRSNVPVTATSL